MKVLGYLTENQNRFYDIYNMKDILGTSKSKIHREIKRMGIKEDMKHRNHFLYREEVVFTIMEILLIEKLENEND